MLEGSCRYCHSDDSFVQTLCRGIFEAFGDEWGNFGLYCYGYCTAIRDCPPL